MLECVEAAQYFLDLTEWENKQDDIVLTGTGAFEQGTPIAKIEPALLCTDEGDSREKNTLGVFEIRYKS